MKSLYTYPKHFSKWSTLLPYYFAVVFSLQLMLPINTIASSSDEVEATEENNPEVSNIKALTLTSPLTLTYYVNNQSLLEDIKYDNKVNQSKTKTLKDGELLILKHNAKNRKNRGNVLFLHTNGESANHHRLVRPLSIQLSHLGWNIYLPNIAKEDFPKPKFGTKRKIFEKTSHADDQATLDPKEKNPKEAEQSLQQNSENQTNDASQNITSTNKDTSEIDATDTDTTKSPFYFDSPDQYQVYIKEICEKISSDPEWSEKPKMLILNQTSSYWGLSCLSNAPMPTILLDPQLPLGAKNDLEDIFSKQSSSFYVFYSQLTANTKMATFSKALSSNQWRSKSQRYSQGILPKGNINIEDLSLAKRITGWAEKLRKNVN